MVSRTFRALAIGAAVAVVPLIAAAPGCGSDAVGVSDCRQIEYVRCELAPSCAAFSKANGETVVSTPADVTSCKEFYRDQCLNGIENADGGPSPDLDSACINALRAAAACAGSPLIKGCKGADVVATTPATEPACNVVMFHPEELTACSWIASPDTGTTTTTTGATTTGATSTGATSTGATSTGATTTGAGGASGAGGAGGGK